MKDIALKAMHEELGAKMVPFAGYNMPLQYAGLSQEHEAVRTGVGVFDVSHMGEFFVTGPNAFDLVQKISTNDVSKLVDGKVQYSCMPNGKGGIVDDLLIYRFNAEKYLLVVNASNIEKDWAWISEQNSMGAEMNNVSDSISLLAVQGPKASEAMQSLTSIGLSDMVYYTFEEGTFAGVENVLVSATGYTGSGGFEIYFDNKDADKIFKAVLDAGKSFDIQPAGLGARDTLRLEMGFCLYGNDIDDTTSPLEAGLGWITKFTDGNDFVDRKFLSNQKEAGVKKKLVAFEMIEKGIPRQGYEIVDVDGNSIGSVTSGTMSPSMKIAIGLGYVALPHNKVDSEIYIQIRKKTVKAKVVKLPFYKS